MSTSSLSSALAAFVEIYHADTKVLAEMAGWSCRIGLVPSDTDEVVGLKIEGGRVTQVTDHVPDDADLLVRSSYDVLLDILKLRSDPSGPYLFGELTVEGPEAHFVRLDYIVTKLCPQ